LAGDDTWLVDLQDDVWDESEDEQMADIHHFDSQAAGEQCIGTAHYKTGQRCPSQGDTAAMKPAHALLL
jgi:hypothetical protein